MYHSVLDPSRNANAAELPETTNNRNLRSMKISCQVTAAISLLETLGNIFCTVIWLFTSKYIGNESLLFGLTLYFILLPYTFLMNTHDNRNLVVEDGWQMVMKNLLGGSKIMECLNSKQVKISNFKKTPVESRKVYLTERDIRFHLYEISRHLNDSKVANINTEFCTLNVPKDEEVYLKNAKTKPRSRDIESQTNRYLISVRSYCINKLLGNVDSEGSYQKLFKIFVELENNIKNGGDVSQIVQLIPLQISSSEIIKKDKETPKCKFICSLDKRIEMRNVILRILLKQNKIDDTMYNKFLNDFINLEKRLIK